MITKMRLLGWVLLIAGGIGTIISALVGSDWSMYGLIIISSAGVVILERAQKNASA